MNVTSSSTALPSRGAPGGFFPDIPALSPEQIETAARAAIRLGMETYATLVRVEINECVDLVVNEHGLDVFENPALLPFQEHEAYNAAPPRALLHIPGEEMRGFVGDEAPETCKEELTERAALVRACREELGVPLIRVNYPHEVHVVSTAGGTIVSAAKPRRYLSGKREEVIFQSN